METTLTLPFLGEDTQFHIHIYGDTYKTFIDFVHSGYTYSFTIERWEANGMWEYLQLFHSHCYRDPALYGEKMTNGALDMIHPQKINALLQGCRDVIIVINAIVADFPTSTLGYAVAHLESQSISPDNMTYRRYIAWVACMCIKKSLFIPPNAVWTDVNLTFI